jgi:hypothetical protein
MPTDSKAREWRGWCVYGFRGWPNTWAIRYNRRDALREAEREYKEPWRKLYRRGFRVRRITITPEDDRG